MAKAKTPEKKVVRRKWSEEEKTKILAEVAKGEETMGAIAERHGINPSQLSAWKAAFEEHQNGGNGAERPRRKALVSNPTFQDVAQLRSDLSLMKTKVSEMDQMYKDFKTRLEAFMKEVV